MNSEKGTTELRHSERSEESLFLPGKQFKRDSSLRSE